MLGHFGKDFNLHCGNYYPDDSDWSRDYHDSAGSATTTTPITQTNAGSVNGVAGKGLNMALAGLLGCAEMVRALGKNNNLFIAIMTHLSHSISRLSPSNLPLSWQELSSGKTGAEAPF